MDIRTFAKLAGVSIATVSRAFSGNGRINPETKRYILKMAEEKGFVPNVHARRLSCQESAVLGVFYSTGSEPVFDYYNMELAQELARASLRQGYAAQLEPVDDESKLEERVLPSVSTGAIDGLVLVAGGPERARELLSKVSQCPSVVIANFSWPLSIPVAGSIFIDFRVGIEQAILRLRELGHEKIGYLRGPSDESKHKAYQASIKKAGLPADGDFVRAGSKSFADGENLVRALLEKGVTAVLCATDILALGMLQTAQQQGVRVPDDLSVIGIDDLALSVFASPGLSSIGVSREHVGKVTVESLTRAIRDKREGQVKTSYFQTVHPQFVERYSIGPVPA